MASVTNNQVYNEIVDVLYDYLGPAAERFLDREIESHLHKKPEDITKSDIPKLHEWSKLAIALLAEDQKTVDEFSNSLLAIAKKHNGIK